MKTWALTKKVYNLIVSLQLYVKLFPKHHILNSHLINGANICIRFHLFNILRNYVRDELQTIKYKKVKNVFIKVITYQKVCP